MKNKIAYLFVITTSVMLLSCSEFISKDITDETVVTLAPSNGDTVSSYSQLFWWEEIEGAEEYHLQIVKPSFTSIQQLLIDTTIEGNKFNFTLQPGIYEWRVRALNNAGYTLYTVNTLTVDSALDLTSQAVQLISPVNNATVSNLTQTFKWYHMPLADQYTLQVLTQGNGTIIYTNSNIAADSLTYTFQSYGSYKWRVWASNSTSSSHYSEYAITISVPVSTPYVPSNNDTLSSSLISMSWTRPAGAGIVSDSLIISEDPSFASIVHSDVHASANHTFQAVQGQQYYWKLRSKTSNGVWSNGYSSTFTFYAGP